MHRPGNPVFTVLPGPHLSSRHSYGRRGAKSNRHIPGLPNTQPVSIGPQSSGFFGPIQGHNWGHMLMSNRHTILVWSGTLPQTKYEVPGAKFFADQNFHIYWGFVFCSRLGLHLPDRVEGEKSQARWLAESRVLEVTLRLNRQYEDLNM